MTLLHVEIHREGEIGDLQVLVHGREPDDEGHVEVDGAHQWVRFEFKGAPGARLRVQIRNRDTGTIVYREEVQLAPSATRFDSCDRYFVVEDVAMAAAAAGLEATATVELEIKVSGLAGVNGYGFAYDGAPVPLNLGKGEFDAVTGQPKRLEWIMRGNPGGTMKVEVLRDNVAIYTREKSTIVPPFGTALDAFEILVR